jgi:hypothetical protein
MNYVAYSETITGIHRRFAVKQNMSTIPVTAVPLLQVQLISRE